MEITFLVQSLRPPHPGQPDSWPLVRERVALSHRSPDFVLLNEAKDDWAGSGERLDERAARDLGMGLLSPASPPSKLRCDAAAAEAQFALALTLAEQVGDRHFAALIRLNLASSMREQGRWAQARPLLEQEVAYLRKHGPGYYLANALQTLAATYRAEGDLPRALELAQEAVDEAVTAQLPLYLPGPLAEIGEIRLVLRDPEEAITAFGEARAIHLAYRDTARAAKLAARIAAAKHEADAQ